MITENTLGVVHNIYIALQEDVLVNELYNLRNKHYSNLTKLLDLLGLF
jgi:hypothetical protein